MRVIALLAALACGISPVCAFAQTTPEGAGASATTATTTTTVTVTTAPAATGAAPAPAADPCTGCITIPALTVVSLEIMSDQGSKTSVSGDLFPIRLAEPIVIDGKEVIPAGATGMGEVIHAKKSGGSGAPGELVLAARYLDVDGRHLRLRSMQIAVAGQSKYRTVDTLNMAGAAVPAVSLVGFFVTGKQISVPKGTVANAKTAEAFSIAAPAPAAAAAPATASTAPVATP